MAEGRKAQVVAIGNQKGGVGKTTTTVNLAAALAEVGRRVLIWDLDANAGATNALGVPPVFVGSFEVMLGVESVDDAILRHSPEDGVVLPENIHLVCARRNLDDLDAAVREQSRFADGRDSLLAPLRQLSDRYDYILLDTAPNSNTPMTAAYKAARWFVIAGMPETLAVRGMQEALADVQAARRYGNPALELLGVVMSRVDKRTRVGAELLRQLEAGFPPHGGMFEAKIDRSVVVLEAQKLGRTVLDAAPDHKVAAQYRRLAAEFEDRLRRRTTGTEDR
ncbi:MAG: ParA family protein [Planctomycetia bacterium]